MRDRKYWFVHLVFIRSTIDKPGGFLVLKYTQLSPGYASSPDRSKLEQSFYRRHGKRAFDLLFALLIAPPVALIVLIVWAATRLDGGPGFFGQVRIGRGGSSFTCWKIRTMVVGAEEKLKEYLADNPEAAAEWERDQKLSHDPRITPLGAFLRKTSLDELPQLWNVLNGDMSLVGPRPFMTEQLELYRAAGGKYYFDMRPGITGVWQVIGRSGTSFAARVLYDNRYWRSMSFGKDLKLIVATVVVVFRGSGR